MNKKKLLDEVSFEKIRPYIQQPGLGKSIPSNDIDYVVSLTILRVRKIIRAAK